VLWRKARSLADRDGDEGRTSGDPRGAGTRAGHAGANFLHGRVLLASDHAAGVEFIERALATDEMLTHPGCELLWSYYSRTGQREKLRELENRADSFQERVVADQRERNSLTPKDVFLPHELTPEMIEKVNLVFAGETDVYRVAVARKQLTVFPQLPMLVFAVTVKVPWWRLRLSSSHEKLVNRLVEKLEPGAAFLLFTVADSFKPIGKKIAALPSRASISA
jgi:hypothetical protein